MAKRYAVHLCGTREYKPGDPEPEGYMEWHEWAGVQHKAGLRQQQCGQCGRWWYPQQLSDQVCVSNPVKGNGQVVEIRSPVCKSCAEVR